MMKLRARAGVILATVLAVLVLIELLAVTILALAHQELAVARDRDAATRAHLASRSLAAHLSLQPPARLQSLAPGQRSSLPADSSRWLVQNAQIERLTGASFLLRTSAAWGPEAWAAHAQSGLLLLGFDPVSALATLPAALNVSGPVDVQESSIQGEAAPGTAGDSACSGFPVQPDTASALALPDSLLLRADSTSRIAGAPAVLLHVLPATLQQLGGLSLEQLIARADRRESGSMALQAQATGQHCNTEAPGNWGAPFEPGHPCQEYAPFSFAHGSLEILSGAGQGTLLVNGDLLLHAGVQFYGLILTQGHLRLEPGARIVGAALARSAALNGASIQRSPCALRRAIRGARAWNQLQPRPARAWLPIF